MSFPAVTNAPMVFSVWSTCGVVKREAEHPVVQAGEELKQAVALETSLHDPGATQCGIQRIA